MSTAVQDVEAYLASAPEEARAALEKLRGQVRAAAPGATEAISYRVPTFVLQARLVGFSAAKNHCSLHLMSPALLAALKDELRGYDTTTATVRFRPDKPLPTALVKKLVKARIAETRQRKGRK